jgi:2-C-methyl-D-erythritol 2,4-cyclodiphosphate synthase
VSTTRCGIGYDIHRLGQNRKLILGGVEIPYLLGLEGHSDADVLSHAIADALLGAICAGDIGQHFPNTDESIRGISSSEILKRVAQILADRKVRIVNVDATVIAEAPKLGPRIPEMQKKLATTLGIGDSQVSIKATTNERLGPIGRGEGISAMAVAMVAQE